MSFKFDHFINLTISFIIGSFFFILGIFSVIVPWSHYLQTITTQFILENRLIPTLFGLGFVLVGLSIVTYAILKARHRYTHIRMGNFSVTLDEKIIRQYLESYWQEQFPSNHIPFIINIKKHSLEIIADLPSLTLADQKKFLEQTKQDFSHLFGRILGYPYDVHLIASFQVNKLSN